MADESKLEKKDNNTNQTVTEDISYTIRVVKGEEIAQIPEWVYNEVGWTTNDASFLNVCYQIDPKGFILAVDKENNIIGAVLSMNMNDKYSFAGLYLVAKSHRFKGIGKVLWNEMLKHVGPRCLGINSVKPRVPSNLKMGFSQPYFKVTIFNGYINRKADILNFNKIQFYYENGRFINANFKDAIQYNTEQNTTLVYFNGSKTNTNNDKGIDSLLNSDKLEVKELSEKTKINDAFNKSVLNMHSGDLARYTFKYTISDDITSRPAKYYVISFMDGRDLDLASILEYDTAIHYGIKREIFLKTYLTMSNQMPFKCRSIVALRRTQSLDNIEKFYNNVVCGYAIIRPRYNSNCDTPKDVVLQNGHADNYNTIEQFMSLEPLYADTPEIAHRLLMAAVNSIPPEWKLNLEMTIPLKVEKTTSDSEKENRKPTSNVTKPNPACLLDPNFLYACATKDLALKMESECFRMYQNDIVERLKLPTKDHENKSKVPYPENLNISRVYSIVSSDIFLL